MIDKRRALTAAATLAAAFATGYIMQNGGAMAARIAGSAPAEAPDAPATSNSGHKADFMARRAAPDLPVDLAASGFGRAARAIHSRRLASAEADFSAPVLSDAPTPGPLQLACAPRLTLGPAPAAMLELSLAAPCDPNSRVTVSHGDLVFTDATDAAGGLNLSIPAMARDAQVSVRFDDGRAVEAGTEIMTLDGFARAGVVWQGAAALHLHALEFGARFGEPGHVWAEAARSPDYGVNARGGFVTRLGRGDVLGPIRAEVYSFPADRMARDGAVRLSIDVEVSETSCGTTVSGKTLELGIDGSLRNMALELTMPQCDALGGYLELKNLLQDMKIARN